LMQNPALNENSSWSEMGQKRTALWSAPLMVDSFRRRF
jgi:hypothetical protein